MLAITRERVHLNKSSYKLAAGVEGRTSLARIGIIVHLTAPTIHAGFNGNHSGDDQLQPILLEDGPQ
jgi:dCTP deaminase